ncbi:MAG: preprotein translocase subunit SecG [Erythrobacter sp.]|uniref:preprotein translocase subunit SecG n=1 Tax=Erythrobacter sp. HL-111 TaxID=1798193 RepID=UPI0006DAC362|nr:preprotein translocase subunit SecG [Erythrobacter sp. HL-111]KPP96649.1 MAG: preprotein translocase subunit SecG [Erythrobacteraceae bacterium HL-111]SDR99243.1 protein translocase subunit secG [Erythrobacter sp. HL-111]
MSLFLFLTVVQAIVAAALVGVVLMQRSEGGGLGIGGSPGGALGARGAADFLTRATKWLAIVFVALSIALAAVAVETQSVSDVTSTLERGGPASRADDLLGERSDAPAEAGEDAPLADPASEDAPAPIDDDSPLAE